MTRANRFRPTIAFLISVYDSVKGSQTRTSSALLDDTLTVPSDRTLILFHTRGRQG